MKRVYWSILAKQKVNVIVEKLDHHFLNDIEGFGDSFPPSSENIAYYIANQLEQSFQSATAVVHSVTTWESHNASATYFPDHTIKA